MLENNTNDNRKVHDVKWKNNNIYSFVTYKCNHTCKKDKKSMSKYSSDFNFNKMTFCNLIFYNEQILFL